MSADFWAGYVSGAAGILIGNPLDIVKVNLQRGSSEPPLPSPTPAASPSTATTSQFSTFSSLLKGTAAPILGYGALNALMFMTYNRSMYLLDQDPAHPTSLSKTWLAGALGGLATFVVSAPTELVKCRTQVAKDGNASSSLAIARQLWHQGGLRALYWGGTVTAVRDSVGYGFYFWSYELSKKALVTSTHDEKPEWMTILLCGGIAGIITWASIFPLDVIKTRVQTQAIAQPATATHPVEHTQLLPREQTRLGALRIARQAYRDEGLSVFFRGLGVCSLRAFFVNAVQWAVYEWMMHVLLRKDINKDG